MNHGATPLTISTPSGPPATIRQTCSGQRVLDEGLLGTGLLTINNVTITGGNLAPTTFGSFAGGSWFWASRRAPVIPTSA